VLSLRFFIVQNPTRPSSFGFQLSRIHSTPQPFSRPFRWIVSGLMLLHFGGIVCAYSANWRRSGLQDDLLSVLNPYLIGMDWSLELIPVEWNRGQALDLPIQLVGMDESGQSIVMLDSQSRDWDRDRKRQILRVLVSLLESQSDDVATPVLASIVAHSERVTGRTFRSIQLKKPLESNTDPINVYEASVVRMAGEPLRFVPVIDAQRTVPRIPEAASSSSQSEAAR